ncbi:MAG: CBM16, partial [uncultured Phycisphaerae bacterium]
PIKQFKLTKDDVPGLLAALKSDNQFWRLHAQRLLVERGDKSVAPELAKMVAEAPVDPIGLSPAAIHALWTMQGLGLLEAGQAGGTGDANPTSAAAAALKHKTPGVRKAAVDVLPRTEAGLAALLSNKVLEDADPQVRKSALLALAEMPQQANPAAGEAVYAALAGPGVGDDRWLADAAMIAGARHDAGFLRAALTAFKVPEGSTEAPKSDATANLVRNGSFEEVAGGAPRGWRTRHYAGEAKQELSTTVARTGKNSVVLKSDKGADTSWYVDAAVEPNTNYKLSAWVKTENVTPVRGGRGAQLNVHGTEFRSPALTGTEDWRRIELAFNSGPQTRVSINCLFGGWGHATGTAYFDDVELTKGGVAVALPGATGKVLSAVITHYAQRSPKESVVPTLAALRTAQPQIATIVIDALSGSWPDGPDAAPQLTAADATELQAVMKALPPAGKDRLLALAGKWGRADLFGEALAAALKDLTARLDDPKATPGARGEAAKRLIAVADTPDAVAAVTKHVNANAGPDVQRELLSALAESRSPAVGEQLIANWLKLSPAAQKVALPMLLRREPWTRSLLAGVQAGTINPKDVLPQQWQALTTHPDPQIGNLAKTLQKSTGQAVSADRKAIVDKLQPVVEKAGDAKRGLAVYERNCQVCHQMGDKGGKVGPDLTGVGARPKSDLLIEVVDPNRSVEGTYRQWSAKTEDDVITGRLLSESQTSVEIIDAAGTVHALQRNQIKSLTASERSVMPEGFEAIPAEELADLLEFLSTSKAKH